MEASSSSSTCITSSISSSISSSSSSSPPPLPPDFSRSDHSQSHPPQQHIVLSKERRTHHSFPKSQKEHSRLTAFFGTTKDKNKEEEVEVAIVLGKHKKHSSWGTLPSFGSNIMSTQPYSLFHLNAAPMDIEQQQLQQQQLQRQSSNRSSMELEQARTASTSPSPPDLISGNDPSTRYTSFPDNNHDDVDDSDNNIIHNINHNSVDMDHLTESQRPSSLSEFFQDLGQELAGLIVELVYYGKTKTWKKKLLTVLLFSSSILVFYDLLFGNHIISLLETFIHWMTAHSAYAVVAFVAIFVLSTLIFIPPTILIFGAGYAFAQAIGFGWGTTAAVCSCFIGSCIGAIIAFLRSRYMMRDLIYLFSRRYPLVRAADRALKRKGFRIMVLLRLCPLIPFNGLNYCCGITGVKVEDFTFSLVGILPFQTFTAIVGATTGTLALSNANQSAYYNNEKQHLGWIILLASGGAFGLIALAYTWKVVRKELQKELELTPEEFELYIHPEETEMEQGGIEKSIEVNHMPTDGGYRGTGEWMEEGEEWFWVWA